MSGLGHRVRDVRAIAIALLAGAAGLTAVLLIVLTDSPEANARAASSRPLPLQTGQAWYSQTLDTSPATVFTSGRKPPHELIDKWVTWQGYEYQRTVLAGSQYPGGYETGDSEPGFGD